MLIPFPDVFARSSHKGRRTHLLSDGERRSPNSGVGSVPALRSSVRIEREEHSLPTFIEAYQVDRAIQDDWLAKRDADAGTTPQRLVPEDRRHPRCGAHRLHRQ